VFVQDTVRNIYAVRAAHEPVAPGLFVERATDEEVAALLALGEHLPRLDGERLPGGHGERLEILRRIDRMVLRGARNPVLEATLDPLLTRIHALRSVSTKMPGRSEAADQEYRAIFAAIRARQPELARDASYRHIVAAGEAAAAAVQLLQPDRRLTALMHSGTGGPPPP
jgi:DNA-binding FadR family transcriptional regulator